MIWLAGANSSQKVSLTTCCEVIAIGCWHQTTSFDSSWQDLGDIFWTPSLRGVDRAWKVVPENICCRHWHQSEPSSCLKDHFLMSYKTWVVVDSTWQYQTRRQKWSFLALFALVDVQSCATIIGIENELKWRSTILLTSWEVEVREEKEWLETNRSTHLFPFACTTMGTICFYWVAELYRTPHFLVSAKLGYMIKAAGSVCASCYVITGGFTFWIGSPETSLRDV